MNSTQISSENKGKEVVINEGVVPLYNHNLNEFLIYLDMCYGIPMNQGSLSYFLKKFTTLYQKAYSKRIQDRVDRNYSIYIVNNILNELNISRELIKYNDKWYLLQV